MDMYDELEEADERVAAIPEPEPEDESEVGTADEQSEAGPDA